MLSFEAGGALNDIGPLTRAAARGASNVAFEEAIHTRAGQYIVESLDLDAAEVFNANHEIESIRDKDEFLLPFIDTLTDRAARIGTPEADYLRFIAIRRCQRTGLDAGFPGAANPSPRMSERMEPNKVRNSAETRVIEQAGGALSWD